ncbi:MAG: PAS domain S-box protein [Candidatus Hydrogenedentes bacterium]|nr:PAS domain S-box protein [Candidatus Hydrogenedentota bacterium]
MASPHGTPSVATDLWREADKWTRAIVESAVDGIITIDESGTIEYINPAAERMFGYAPHEILGRNVSVLMKSEDSAKHDNHLARYRATGKRSIIGSIRELEGRHKSGRIFPFELSVSEVLVGERRLFTGILHDITSRRLAQEEKDQLLRNLHKRNIEITSLYRVGEIVRSGHDLSETCDDIAKAMWTAFQEPERIRARVSFDGGEHVCGPDSPSENRIVADIVVAGRKRGEVEVSHVGAPIAADSPFLTGERDLIDGIAAVLGETVERRDAQSKVIQASKLASIGELAAGVGHEINNPLNAIINCADILMQGLADGSKERQFAELVRSEAERIARIVRNLLTFSRQDREAHSPARLSDIVETVLSLSRKKIAKSKVDLHVDVPEDLPKLKCRSEQLQQVLMNLIINALHSLDERYPDGHPDKFLSISARPYALDGRDVLRLTVEDHGCGIAPVHIQRLFDPFFTTKGRDVGTGLGLSVSDGIVKDHGGQIAVESEYGQYARFHVDLPLDNGWTAPLARER